MTPLTCLNTASMPQKQPAANTAVCRPAVFTSAASTAGLGRGAVSPSARAGPHRASARDEPASRVRTRRRSREVVMVGLSSGCFLSYILSDYQRTINDEPKRTHTPATLGHPWRGFAVVEPLDGDTPELGVVPAAHDPR